MPNLLTQGQALMGALKVGGGSLLRRIKAGTISVDPPSIGAATTGTVALTITGVAVGDLVILMPPSTLEDDLIPKGSPVTAADTVTLLLYNPTGAAIDGAARTWQYLWFDLT